jgi:serine/threonine kinase 32
MDYMPGGDLRYHFAKQRKFTEEQAKFFAACMITGLEYLHINGVIHRDIKPENLVLDNKGYLRITDFGVAKVW